MRTEFLSPIELDACPRRLVSRGETICSTNQQANLAFFIEEGEAKISNLSKVMSKGDLIGFVDLIAEENYFWNILAKKECRLICFDKNQLAKTLNKQSTFLWPIVKVLAYEFSNNKRAA